MYEKRERLHLFRAHDSTVKTCARAGDPTRSSGEGRSESIGMGPPGSRGPLSPSDDGPVTEGSTVGPVQDVSVLLKISCGSQSRTLLHGTPLTRTSVFVVSVRGGRGS